jgi:hypothetical protein
MINNKNFRTYVNRCDGPTDKKPEPWGFVAVVCDGPTDKKPEPW